MRGAAWGAWGAVGVPRVPYHTIPIAIAATFVRNNKSVKRFAHRSPISPNGRMAKNLRQS